MSNVLLLTNSAGGRWGYSTVGDNVAQALREAGHAVVFQQMQYMGPPYVKYGIIYGGVKYDPWASDSLEEYIRMYGIDTLITIIDMWMPQVRYIGDLVKRLGVKWICHVTVNTVPTSPYLVAGIHKADVLVAPSRFVETELKNSGFKNVVRIPHGVDTDVFRPGDRTKYKDQFIFLSVGRNRGVQKGFDELFYAYKTFLSKLDLPDKAKTKMLILTDPSEPQGFPLLDFRNSIGMQNDIKFIWAKWDAVCERLVAADEGEAKAAQHNANMNFGAGEMAEIYNNSDAYVSASQSESFGLPILESLACGKPVIFPDHSTCDELVKSSGAGLAAKIKMQVTTPTLGDIGIVDSADLAEQMYQMYTTYSANIERWGKFGANFASFYDWKKIRPIWAALVNKMETTVGQTDYARGVLGV